MSTLQQQARTLIDYLKMPTVIQQHGAETCATLQSNLWMYLNSCTPEEAAPLLQIEIEATRSILRKGAQS